MSITSVINDTVTSVSLVNAQKPLPPTISGYSVAGKDDVALDPAGGQTVQVNGTGFLPGATITFDGSAVSIVTYANANQLTFTSPAKSAGTYTIYVVNPDGGTAIYIPGIIYSTLPTWTTSAGSLGSYYETQSISNTVVASGDAPITYSLFSGSLPTGATLYSNGVISGSAPVDSSSTTYSFTIQATDAQLQDSTRSFSLTINTDVVTWVSPANATTYTSAVNSAISNVTLSATDAAGYGIVYTANSLPTGLSLSGNTISGTPTVIADSSTLLTATANTTSRSATRTINWSITVANDPYFEYNTLLIPGASTTFVDDASTNNFAITINGDTKPNNFNPYTPGYYSNYFDGTGDYLTTPANAGLAMGTGDFTWEAWIYFAGGSTYRQIFSTRASDATASTTAGSLSVNTTNGLTWFTNAAIVSYATSIGTSQWVHVAVCRSGTTLRVFANGIQVGSATNSDNLTANILSIGANNNGAEPFTGYISNVRIVKGTAVYTSGFTPSTIPLTAISGTSLLTCQSNRFIDNSTNNFTITVNGNTTVNSFDPFIPNSSYSTYGSGYFDGTGDYLITPSSDAFSLGTGDFTYEAWIYPINNPIWGQIVGPAYNANGLVLFCHNRALVAYTSGVVLTWTIIQMDAWQHVAVTRQSGTVFLYHNGVKYGTSASLPGSLTNTPFYIGANSSGSETFTGYITDVRIVKGTAVYTTTFTPPSTPLTAIANTSLLTLQNNQSVNNSVFLDNSSNNFLVTRAGNTTQGTFSPYGGNWSNYFDGTGDYLVNSSMSMTLGTSNFCMEAWGYWTSFNAGTYGSPLFSFGGTNSQLMIRATKTSASSTSVNYYSTNNSNFIPSAGYSSGISAGTIYLNVWNHIALTREGSTWRLFVNGILVNTQTDAGSLSTAYTSVTLGADTNPAYGYLTGWLSNARMVVGSAVYTTNFTPPTQPLTAISGTQLLSAQSNRFIDNSINNYTLTKNGDTSVQRFSPFNPSSLTPTSYSGYFDGTGDYLNTPSNAVFGFGTGDFTIEGWFYFTGTISTYQRPWWFGDDNDNIDINSSVLRVGGASQGTLITGGTTILANTWYHIALTRASGSYKLWLNGSQQGSSASNSYNSSARTFTAMATSGGANPSTGYVSNLRIVKGTAVYTTTFTPPTSPLTAISGTSLLTLQSTTFIDNSTNNFTLTVAGNTQPSIQNPFGYTSTTTNGYSVSTIGGSGYFDGTGDYFTAPTSASLLGFSTNNFTVEYWVYPTAFASYKSMYGNSSSAANATGFHTGLNASGNVFIYSASAFKLTTSNAMTLNAWNHVAIVRNGSTITVYINGISGGTWALTSQTFTDGYCWFGAAPGYASEYYAGYMSDLRVNNSTALYTGNFVTPPSPLTAISNTTFLTNMTNAGIYDASMMNDMETLGDAKLSTAVTKFGGSSVSFDGSGDSLKGISASPSFQFGTGDFTVECWVYTSNLSSYQTLIDTRSADTQSAYGLFINNSAFPAWYDASGFATSSVAVSSNTWTHVAVSRSSGTLKVFVNGTSGYSGSNTNAQNPTGNIVVGMNISGSAPYNGYIDDLRITKGYARYTSNFTAPTSAFPIY